MAETGWTQTFAELDAAANRLSQAVPLDRPATRRPRRLLPREPSPLSSEILWGCEYAGLIYTAASSRLTTDELTLHRQRLRRTGVHHVDVQGRPGGRAASTRRPAVELRLMLDGVIDGYESYERDRRGPVRRAARRAAWRAPTCSTRRAPPAAQGRAAASRSTLETAGAGTRRRRCSGSSSACSGRCSAWTTAKVYLSPAPMYHAAPLRFCAGDARARRDRRRHGALRRRALSRRSSSSYRATHTQVVPTMFVRMLKLPDEVRAAYDVSSLECVDPRRRAVPGPGQGGDDRLVGTGDPRVLRRHRGQRVHATATARCGSPTRARSGCRSTARCTSSATTARSCRRARSAPSTSRAARSFEYHNDPEKTAGSRHPTGWSTLGDVGYLDADNYLYLTDRKAYMIITGGVNVYPAGGGERARHAPEGDRRRRVRRAQRGLRRGGQGGRAAGRRCRPTPRPRPRSRAS